MKVGLLSDTHSFLDKRVLDYFKDVDEVWHAGDIGNMEVIKNLTAFKLLRAVYGNIDDTEMRGLYPENLFWECEGVKFFMTHIGGAPHKYPTRIKNLFIAFKPDIFICGHSHILRVMNDKPNNLLYLNPGACGNEGFHKVKTLMRFTVSEGKISALEIIELL